MALLREIVSPGRESVILDRNALDSHGRQAGRYGKCCLPCYAAAEQQHCSGLSITVQSWAMCLTILFRITSRPRWCSPKDIIIIIAIITPLIQI